MVNLLDLSPLTFDEFLSALDGQLYAYYSNIELAKENEKFIYGLLHRLYNVSKPEHPLSAFDQLSPFKLFLFDTGLLKHMAGIDNAAILLKSDYQFKGPLTENYIQQQLLGQFEVAPRYFSDKSGEIGFKAFIRNIPLYLAVKMRDLI